MHADARTALTTNLSQSFKSSDVLKAPCVCVCAVLLLVSSTPTIQHHNETTNVNNLISLHNNGFKIALPVYTCRVKLFIFLGFLELLLVCITLGDQ